MESADAEAADESGFQPLLLTQEASLNGTRLADVVGAARPLVGRRAAEVLSSQALGRLAGATGFGGDETHGDVPTALARALASDDPRRMQRAERVVAPFGRALGHLIVTLVAHAGSDDEPVGPWRRAYRRHWSQVEHVWLGGGLAAALGARLLEATQAEIERLGVHHCHVALGHHPDVLGLIGVARRRWHPSEHVVVLDFGHSAVKRGIATFDAETLARLELLPSIAASGLGDASTPAEVAAFVVSVIAGTVAAARRQHGKFDPRLIISLASYVADGWPANTRGTYARLHALRHDELDAELRRRTEADVSTWFMHDGTAAASGLSDPGRAGLIVLGTWLSAGFPAPVATLLPVSSNLAVCDRRSWPLPKRQR